MATGAHTARLVPLREARAVAGGAAGVVRCTEARAAVDVEATAGQFADGVAPFGRQERVDDVACFEDESDEDVEPAVDDDSAGGSSNDDRDAESGQGRCLAVRVGD